MAAEIREITIKLDTYDDIFSDFDPRPYSQRELSEDFLKEVQRRYMEDKHGRFEVHFTIPSSERDTKEEALIKKRIREHFSQMAKAEHEEIKKTQRRGYVYIAIGAAVLLANVAALFTLHESSWFYQVLSILLVPAGWYGMFTGIGKVIDEPVLSAEKKAVYERFEKANYIFMSEELE
ncbi:MAG: hypothetical protein N3F07_02850 [Candidatus Micrarchaeota archaeon]|nr:hypothetical protein [Candidatus Micrarchaeota archaeon]